MMKLVCGLIAGAGVAIISGALVGQIHKPEMRPTDTKESIARGESVYKSHCAICHFAASSEKKIGPGMKGISNRAKFADGTKIDNPSLVKRIENGGKNMPPMRGDLSDAQIRDLLAYLRTL